ncbi:MAG: hypothetical protein ABJD57_08550, partial [Roseibium sp.]|uniref:hypothetical protein n=1 Tax=Roseibium sp. TaxID=1936156 RepID=UPI003264189E
LNIVPVQALKCGYCTADRIVGALDIAIAHRLKFTLCLTFSVLIQNHIGREERRGRKNNRNNDRPEKYDVAL